MKTKIEHYLQFSDAILIRLVSKRCKVSGLAFEGLMKRYEQDAFRISRSILHHKADEKDAWSESRVEVLKRILKGVYMEMGKFDRFFKSIVFAEAYKILRKRKSITFGEEVTEYLQECIREDDGINKYESYELYSERKNKLPEEYREVHDAAMQGISLEDISENLGIPIGTVRSRNSRAKQFLAKLYSMKRPKRKRKGKK
jgi:RNA polymerase sigma-70 factor (ECF subfamily)